MLSKKYASKTDIELETKIMQNEEMNNFIVKLWFTLTDSKYVYMYMEACLGRGSGLKGERLRVKSTVSRI